VVFLGDPGVVEFFFNTAGDEFAGGAGCFNLFGSGQIGDEEGEGVVSR